jgi:nitrate reductase gamma subunit
MNGLLFFILLPYLALISLILGSIYRYFFRGFQVSSLSSQLLESRLLFFGNRPFHWGIIILLIGHLIGFLIPSAVLAWNNRPVRLYILEITAFAFGFITLLGLIALIVRRVQVKRIRRVTTFMDIVVFLVLISVIVSGLYTAFFYRWGSSWFALVLVPYLRSVLAFTPDITAVTALPAMVKIHVISTFVFFGIIPYSRFIHIVVYPFSYFWREYQVVVWNKRKKSDPPDRSNQKI